MVLILYLILIITTSATNTESLYQDNRFLYFNFQIYSSSLPIFLQNLLTQQKIKSITIKQGFLHNPTIPINLPHQGIHTFLQTKQVSIKILKILTSLFTISTNNNFIHYLPQLNQTYISDPNDKLCIQQIQQIIRTFLPCKTLSGIASILNSKKLLFGGYIGVQVLWRPQLIKIGFIVQKQVPLSKNLLNIKLESCQFLQFKQPSQYSNRKPILDQLEAVKPSQEVLNSPTFQKYSINKWYSPSKCLIHKITSPVTIKTVIFYTMLPKGFIFEHSTLSINNQSIKIYKETISFNDQNTFLKFQLQTPNNTQIPLTVSLKCFYRSTLKGFEQFQTIAGGGEELMQLPALIKVDQQKSFQIMYPPSVSERLLEPDFSIPFHTITFSIAIVGYLWFAIWRRFIEDQAQSTKVNRKKVKDQ